MGVCMDRQLERAGGLCLFAIAEVSYSVVQCLSWSCGMILSFRDDWLREFFVNDVRSKKIPSSGPLPKILHAHEKKGTSKKFSAAWKRRPIPRTPTRIGWSCCSRVMGGNAGR